jgi:hypothetical protein
MALPWVRLDSSIASHDKILALLSDPSPKRWQAAASYMFALGWSGVNGTDGVVPKAALMFVHGNADTARLLVKHRLWKEAETGTGWEIPNYADRQELTMVTEARRAAASLAGKKAACVRHHGPDCGCWKRSA